VAHKPTIAGRASAAWRAGGVAALLGGLVAKFGEANVVVLFAARTGDERVGQSGNTPTFEWAGMETFDRVLATPAFQFPRGAARRARQWLARGDRCLLGRVGDRPATYLWVGTLVREFPGATCPIGAGTAYVYKTFTLPEFRGRGLNTAALHEIRRRCASEGYHQVLIDVASNNTASRRAIERAGFVPVGRFFHVRLGRMRRAWLTPSVRRRISSAVTA
jgi:RimJ/RimL family protein N-acetyltransferase